MPNNNQKRAKTLGTEAVRKQAVKASQKSPWRRENSCTSTKAHDYAKRIAEGPGRDASLGQFNAWVESGDTKEERARRLDVVPPHYRDDVRRHVETVFAIRKFNNRKRREKREEPKR